MLDDGDSIRIEQLSLSFTALAKLEFEATFSVKNLNTMRVGIGNNDLIIGVDSNSGGFGELAICDAEFTKLTVVYHLGSLELRSRRK